MFMLLCWNILIAESVFADSEVRRKVNYHYRLLVLTDILKTKQAEEHVMDLVKPETRIANDLPEMTILS